MQALQQTDSLLKVCTETLQQVVRQHATLVKRAVQDAYYTPHPSPEPMRITMFNQVLDNEREGVRIVLNALQERHSMNNPPPRVFMEGSNNNVNVAPQASAAALLALATVTVTETDATQNGIEIQQYMLMMPNNYGMYHTDTNFPKGSSWRRVGTSGFAWSVCDYTTAEVNIVTK
jgi:hypothetical protein